MSIDSMMAMTVMTMMMTADDDDDDDDDDDGDGDGGGDDDLQVINPNIRCVKTASTPLTGSLCAVGAVRDIRSLPNSHIPAEAGNCHPAIQNQLQAGHLWPARHPLPARLRLKPSWRSWSYASRLSKGSMPYLENLEARLQGPIEETPRQGLKAVLRQP